MYYSGSYSGRHFEVLPYYRRGSLRGRRFGIDELKSRIIPEINEALGALHDAGIIHKDLKPSNIMLTDSGDIAIIDFGISSVQSDGSTVIVTSTGMTPEYSAPETFRRLFLEESDYYSFGITLYELFCGHTPYADMTAGGDCAVHRDTAYPAARRHAAGAERSDNRADLLRPYEPPQALQPRPAAGPISRSTTG